MMSEDVEQAQQRGMTAQQVLEIVREGAAAYPDEKARKANSKGMRIALWVCMVPILLFSGLVVFGRFIPYQWVNGPMKDVTSYAILVLFAVAMVALVGLFVVAIRMDRANEAMRERWVARMNGLKPREGAEGRTGFPPMTFGRVSSYLRVNADPSRPLEFVFACSPEMRLGGSVNVVLPERTDPTLPLLPEGESYTMELRGSKTEGAPLMLDALCSCLDMHAAQYGADAPLSLEVFDDEDSFCMAADAKWDVYPLEGNTFVIGGCVAAEAELVGALTVIDKNVASALVKNLKQRRVQRR